MILFDGMTYESSEQNRLLSLLKKKIPTLLGKTLSPEVVIEAVECLREDLLAGRFDDLLTSFPKDIVETYKEQAVTLLNE